MSAPFATNRFSFYTSAVAPGTLAALAGYNAALPNKTQAPANRIGTNPNGMYAQQQRVRLSLEGENAVKNTSFGVNYLNVRRAYCSSQIAWQPDTGDAALDEQVSAKCKDEWDTMGIECSMQDAFSRAADVYLPTSGDSALQWYRDEKRFRLIEVTGDRIGEPYVFFNAGEVTADIDGRKVKGLYAQGTLWQGPNIVGYKIYNRNGDASYVNPQWHKAADIIFFKDDMTGGVRGVSKFVTALQDVTSGHVILQATKDTMLQQSKIAAIASNNSGAPSEYDYQTVQGSDGTIDYVESFADGAVVKYQFNGDSYQVLKSETPSDAFLKGLKYVDGQASRSVGMSPAFLIGSEEYGGASVRLEIEKASREITRIREHVHRPRLNKISYVTIMDLVERGELPAHPNITRGAWHFGTLPTADAFRDDASNIDAIRAGITTRAAVIAANSGQTFPALIRQTAQETIAIHKAAQDVNRALIAEGYEPTATTADIALNTDNPAGLGTPTEKAPNPQPEEKTEVAKMSAFIGDVLVSTLPASTQEDISKMIGEDAAGMSVTKFGMTVPELIAKADKHNLETARKNIKSLSGKDARSEYFANNEKSILLMNDKVIDGHHFLSKAEKAKITSSLRVIDLTPIRFQKKALPSAPE